MSYKFSRRDFLKYSALTVVAVAGAGMLSGCEVQDPSNPIYTVGNTISVGNTQAKLILDGNEVNGKFTIQIANVGDAPLNIREDRFNVAVTATVDGKDTVIYNSAYPGNGMKITKVEAASDSGYPNLIKKGTVTLNLEATNFTLPEEGSYTMVFQYIPIASQAELSMRWKKTGEVIKQTGDSGSTDGDNTITTNE